LIRFRSCVFSAVQEAFVKLAIGLFLSVLLLASLLWLAGGWGVARVVSRVRKPSIFDVLALTPYELRVPFSDVRFQADDGFPLFGWWMPSEGSKRVIVLCSGYRGTKSEVVSLAPPLVERGFHVLAFDLRGQGGSGLSPVTMGYREWRDVVAAVRLAHERVPGCSVGALAFSMGGAAAILAAADGAEVDALVTDSAYANASDVVAHCTRLWGHLPGWALVRPADWFLHRRLGFRLADVCPADGVGRIAPRPLLLIHGTDDSVVPVEHAHRLYDRASQPKELWLVPGANHVGAYFVGRKEYLDRVSAFFEEWLRPATQSHEETKTPRM
jgi:uncharacterized protein